MRFLKTAALAAGLALVTSLSATEKLADGLYAEFITPRGSVLAELYYKQAPLMCANFTGLAEGSLAPQNGKPFYTGLTFYRVVPGFVIQSGNPGLKDTDDDAVAHPHRFPDEFVPGLRHERAGMLSMANAGPDTNSCEFFLTLAATQRLNYLHSVFGRVIRGFDELQQIKQDDACTIKILRVGAEARAFKNDAAAFHVLVAAAKPYAGAKEPGPTAPFDDPDHLLPQDVPRAKNFNFKLANFERITGVKLVARIFAKAPTEEEDKIPGAYMKALAEQVGTAQHGAVAAYFAADDDWRIWFSEEAAARFLGHTPTAADLVAEGPLHQVKTAFMDAAIAEGNAAFERQKQSSPPAQRLKLQTDAMLDGLIIKLEPK
jgi:cyclophilin family peptidyl-prolyl cis-trans isomerase